MTEQDTKLDAVRNALAACGSGGHFRDHATAVLAALGYRSELTENVGGVAEFVDWLGSDQPFTDKQRGLFASWRSADIVFQFTDTEIADQSGLFAEPFDRGRAKSFLFVAADLEPHPDGHPYTRTELATMTRAVNSRLQMPVILLFRHGETLTLAAVHRRAHKGNAERDVLERVTLIKDICTAEPHRAHLDILCDLALDRFLKQGARTFDDLHTAWERVLDIEELNRRFYRELFAWFERAADECTFPDDGAGDGFKERHVIRLITRLLFIWFLKEKGLVPEKLFGEDFANVALKTHGPERTDYYRAVLQNLFFATLNTLIDKRAFSSRSQKTHRDFSLYRYRDLLADPDCFTDVLATVPFVNGGLFDCLDDFEGRTAGGQRVDVFTDNKTQRDELDVPARLLFDDDGLFPLFRKFKFTVEENTPIDQEVALDPELLGRVFEHLLAAYNPETRETARKTTGSYYTPRKVVDYMVHEALTEALATTAESADGDKQWWRDRMDYLLDHSDAMDDASELFSHTERVAVVTAIANLTVLDPAVGSGAFPMAILQSLTLALRRLDPDNSLWETLQKQRASERAGRAFDTRDQYERDAELAEISDTFEKYRTTDFGRKLYLIQNSIFGVDIQPIACQIAKLRFFISLVIEQAPDPDEDNLGIRPLPNLETRFVAADTLLGLERPAQLGLTTDAVRQLHAALQTNRERHFHAGDRNAKLALRDVDSQLRITLAAELEKLGFPAGAAAKVAAWNPYDQNARAHWFDTEYMFGVSGGFDVVIGNPPYVQLQRDRGRAADRYARAGFETFARTGDLYQLFYECGSRLLKSETGTLAYITSNSWLKAKYGKLLRSWFARHHTPLRLVEMGKDVFDAIVDTAVLIVRSGKSNHAECPAVDIDHTLADQFPPPRRRWGTLIPDGNRPWMTLSSIERSVMEKMEAIGTPLRDWDISIYRGILTGYNSAFIVNNAVRDRLIAGDVASDEILKPVLRGRDIARYQPNWAGLWLISTFPSLSLNIDSYPAVRRHLLSFGKDRLAQDGRRLPGGGSSRKKTPHAWYELQDTCAYHAQFSQETIFWMDLTPEGRFSYIPAHVEMYCTNTVYFMRGLFLKHLVAFLNSPLITWYVNKTAATSGMGTARWFSYIVEGIPVPCPMPHMVDLGRLVERRLSDEDRTHTTHRQVEMEIDALVCGSYDITEKEKKVLKGRPHSI